MYLLYLDESGNPDDPQDRHFILAGAAVFERVTYFLSRDVDGVQTKHFPNVQPISFHASEIRSGSGFWRHRTKEKRAEVLTDLALTVARANHPGVFLFAAVVEKSATLFGEAAVRRATEEICRRFDIFLARQYHEFNDPQRGLIVFAESRYQQRHRVWVQDFRQLGTQWGAINNLSDVPYFSTPSESRLLQVADLIAHATFRLYERADPELIRHFINRFDQRDGVLHGLAHVTANRQTCPCPRCHSGREAHHFGAWI